MKKLILILAIILLSAASYYFGLKNSNTNHEVRTENTSSAFVDSTPLSGDVYAAGPVNVTLNFNRDVVEGSTIFVKSSDGEDWTLGEVKIEDNSTVLKRDLRDEMPDGIYSVDYRVCLASGCSDSSFNFTIDSTKLNEYMDLRGQESVTILMQDYNFDKPKVLISPNTKVIWRNVGHATHFVNTETHPEHTYFPEQNSLEIKVGETFSTTFDRSGQYNYHCSAHVPEGMLGSIVVSD